MNSEVMDEVVGVEPLIARRVLEDRADRAAADHAERLRRIEAETLHDRKEHVLAAAAADLRHAGDAVARRHNEL